MSRHESRYHVSLKAGTFISREAYISIDSNDDVIALHSYSDFQSDISVCHVVKVINLTSRNKSYTDPS